MNLKRVRIAVLGMLLLTTVLGCTQTNAGSQVKTRQELPLQEQVTSSQTPSEQEKESKIQTQSEREMDYAKLYEPLILHYYQLLAEEEEISEAQDGEVGVLEVKARRGSREALQNIGYAVEDISGDEIPELLLGAINRQEGDSFYGSEIYALYTLEKDKVKASFEGWSRSSYSYLGDGRFFHQGSGGASYSAFGVFTLSPDGRSLTCQDYYFTYDKEGDPWETLYYHNKTGQWNRTLSEELKISDEEFWKMATDLESQTKVIQLKPFSQVKGSEESAEQEGESSQTGTLENTHNIKAKIQLFFAEDALKDYSNYTVFIADASGDQVKVLVTTDTEIHDVKVLALHLEDVSDQGVPRFSTEEIYQQERLTPESPLMIGLTFYGSTPHYGISYLDVQGERRNLSFELSGEDGSLLMRDF